MVLRRRAFDNRMVSGVVDMPVVPGMHRWCRSFGRRRSLLAGQERLRPQDYECGTIDYLQLRNVVGIL